MLTLTQSPAPRSRARTSRGAERESMGLVAWETAIESASVDFRKRRVDAKLRNGFGHVKDDRQRGAGSKRCPVRFTSASARRR